MSHLFIILVSLGIAALLSGALLLSFWLGWRMHDAAGAQIKTLHLELNDIDMEPPRPDQIKFPETPKNQ